VVACRRRWLPVKFENIEQYVAPLAPNRVARRGGLVPCAYGITAWLTLFRKGTVRMTQPTIIGFFRHTSDGPRVFLPTLLFSTSKQTHVVENIYATLRRGDTIQTFSIWAHGETQANMTRASGLSVGQSGIFHNHHFMLPPDGSKYEFLPGDYVLDIFAQVFGESSSARLGDSLHLVISREDAEACKDDNTGVVFNWAPDARRYYGKPLKIPEVKIPDLLQLLGKFTPVKDP